MSEIDFQFSDIPDFLTTEFLTRPNEITKGEKEMSKEKKPGKFEYYIYYENPISRANVEGFKTEEATIEYITKHFAQPNAIIYKVEYTPIKRVTIKKNTTVDIVEEEL